jgi:outer membrane protein assembly factor BamB
MFMGNAAHTGEGSGMVGNLPLRLAWSVDTGGDPDFASPILAGRRIYLALKKRTRGRTNGVAAFDPVSGERLWVFETPMAINHTPAFAGGILCVAEMGGRIYGLEAATGRKKWQHDLIDDRGRYSYCAPAARDGWFYAGVMRRFAKLRAADGAVEWEKQIGGADNDWISSYGSPAVSGGMLVMAGQFSRGESVVIARASDGSRVWGHAGDGMLGSATMAGDRVLVCSQKSILYCRRLSDGEALWEQGLGARDGAANWSATTPAVQRTGEATGLVVAGSGDGRMSGVNLADGQIVWTHVSKPALFKVSPYRRDDRPLLSSPTIAGEKVFFGSADGRVYCLDLRTGEERWSFVIGASVMSTPLVSGNAVYVAAYDGRLYAFTTGTGN